MATDDAPNLRRLARQLVDVTRRLKHLETVPQLAHSSLDDHGLPVLDADGNVVAKLGKQDDGTWGAPPLDGPVPPQPTGVTAQGDAGVVNVSWGGAFTESREAPLDFDGVEVLVGGELAGAIHDRDGGSISIPAAEGIRVVSWRTRSLAGKVSSASDGIVVQVLAPPSKIAEGLAAAEGRIDDAEKTLDETRTRLDDTVGQVSEVRDELDGIDWDNLGTNEVFTDGPPPSNPTIGSTLWVAPSGRVFRAIECEEHT